MKRRLVLIVLCAILLASLFPGRADAAETPLSFISLNDTLPPELINVATTFSGQIYVPYWLLTNYGFGLNYAYFADNATAYLFNSKQQFFFELPTGKTYDSDDNVYAASAIMWGGTVYLPLNFVANTFGGFTYRYIGENEYGSILRICNGGEILTDDDFFRAAVPAMRRYYQSYYNKVPEETPMPTDPPAPVVTPGKPDDKTETLPRMGDAVRLGLLGMPAQSTLDLMQRLEFTACFFLSEEDMRSDPDMVREILCAGHSIGVDCPDGMEKSWEETASLLWEIARVRTTLAAIPEDAVFPDGAVVFPEVRTGTTNEEQTELVHDVEDELEMRSGDQTLLFSGTKDDVVALRMLLYYLRDQGFTVRAIRETDGGGTPIVP